MADAVSVTVALLVVLVTIVIVAVVAVVLVRRRRSGLGRRPDGSWEEGRRVRDMTPGGKAALTVMFAALATVLLMVIFGVAPLWSSGGFAVVILAGGVAIVSERRRVRREGIDPLTYR